MFKCKILKLLYWFQKQECGLIFANNKKGNHLLRSNNFMVRFR